MRTRGLILLLFWISSLAFSQEGSKDTVITLTGKASYYASKFNGRKTSNGEIFYNDSLTAAHKSLPFGTRVRVTSIKTAKTVIVRINDRLPKTSKRLIDLSQFAAKELGMIRKGIDMVTVEILP